MPKLDRIDPSILSGNSRASLASWLKYQDIVTTAVRQHPKPHVFRPASLSPATVCSRLRDAIRGCLAFGYPSDVSPQDLLRWYDEIIIKHDSERVYIGVPEKLAQNVTAVPENRFHFPSLSYEEIAAFAVLLSGERLSGPIVIEKPPDLSLLPERPNVERIQKADGSLVLL